jgi:FixJ family two-component response regulator
MDRNAYNFLVVEDNPGDIELLDCYLQEQFKSLLITHASCFKEAKRILCDGKVHFDVVLLDLSLPDKSGKALMDEMLSMCQAVPIIVLTGFGNMEFGARSLAMGVSDYIQKDELSSPLLYKSIIYSLERQKSIHALHELIAAIEFQNKQLKEISWVQSHIVRAPVAKILGLVSLLGDISGPKADIINHLTTATQELDQIIRSITKKIDPKEFH